VSVLSGFFKLAWNLGVPLISLYFAVAGWNEVLNRSNEKAILESVAGTVIFLIWLGVAIGGFQTKCPSCGRKFARRELSRIEIESKEISQHNYYVTCGCKHCGHTWSGMESMSDFNG